MSTQTRTFRGSRARTLAGLLAFFIAGHCACTSAEAPRPNILLISIDTLRADHLGCYGYARDTSPRIDEFARTAVTFRSAFSHSPKTSISHMSIFTGLLPEAHGVEQWRSEGSPRLDPAIPTLAELLKRTGYQTLNITGGAHMRGDLGFANGVDANYTVYPIDDAVDLAGREMELAASRDAPFYLFLHTYSVHDPYIPEKPYNRLFTDPGYRGAVIDSPREYRRSDPDHTARYDAYWRRVDVDDSRDVAHLRDLYDGGIRMTDERIGALFDRMRRNDLFDDTLIVLLSDHGEEFGEHDGLRHEQIYQELLHVPLIVRFPGEAEWRGRREDAVVRLIDLLPTLLDYLELPAPRHLQGTSLLPRLAGESDAEERSVLSSWNRDGWSAIREGNWKLVRRDRSGEASRRELYQLSEDPGETKDVSRVEHDRADALEARLVQHRAESERFRAGFGAAETVAPDDEALERLRALGYLESAEPANPQ